MNKTSLPSPPTHLCSDGKALGVALSTFLLLSSPLLAEPTVYRIPNIPYDQAYQNNQTYNPPISQPARPIATPSASGFPVARPRGATLPRATPVAAGSEISSPPLSTLPLLDKQRFSLHGGLGSLGFMGAIAYRYNRYLGARLPFGYFKYSDVNVKLLTESMSFDFTLGGAGLLVDLFPFENYHFRLSSGFIYSAMSAKATYSGTFTFSDTEYSSIGFEAEIKANQKFQPTVALGYDWIFDDSPYGMTLDIGVSYHGAFEASLKQTSGSNIPEDDIAAEIENQNKTLKSSLKSLSPYLMIGGSYYF